MEQKLKNNAYKENFSQEKEKEKHDKGSKST